MIATKQESVLVQHVGDTFWLGAELSHGGFCVKGRLATLVDPRAGRARGAFKAAKPQLRGFGRAGRGGTEVELVARAPNRGDGVVDAFPGTGLTIDGVDGPGGDV